MTTPITNYTTYDLAYYYADLKRLAPLSQEQRHTLFSSVSVTQTTRSCTDAERRQHHIESYLPLVKHLAITLCPPRARARQREARLTQVYTRLQAQRGRVTSSLLAKEAQVKKETAVDFLKARKGEVEHAAV